MRVAFVSLETVHHRETETNARLQTVVDLLSDRRNQEVHVFCAKFWDGERRSVERDGVVYHAVSPDFELGKSFLLRLPFALRSIGPDVVHVAARPSVQVLAASVGATLSRAPLFVEWYGEGGVTNDRGTRWAAGRSDRIVTPSRLVETWVRELGVDGSRIEVIPNPVDLERIRSIEPADPVDVVYARRLDQGANLESLLLGLAELRTRDWTAAILGDGPERDTYEELARDLRIEDRITFAGDTTLDERIATYRSAHVFAQTARRCVFPTELLWALASGCIGIVEYHADSSAHELVEGRTRGFRTTSEQELADAILAAGDLEHRDYDEAFEGFHRRQVLERYLQSYREMREEYGLI